MASPDDPEATRDAPTDSDARRPALPVARIELPIYRPRRRVALVFWTVFVVAAIVAAVLVWLVLA